MIDTADRAGRINLGPFRDAATAAYGIAPLLHRVTIATGIETGSWMTAHDDGVYLLGVLIGTDHSVPGLADSLVPDNAIAAIHAHPTDELFSVIGGDLQWVQNTGLPLFLVGPDSQLRMCVPGLDSCSLSRRRSILSRPTTETTTRDLIRTQSGEPVPRP